MYLPTDDTAPTPAAAPEPAATDWKADPTIARPTGSGVSLFSQVLAVNTVIIIATVFTASVAARLDIHTPDGTKSFLIAILAILLTALVNGWLLRRRFRPLERLMHALEEVDLESPTLDTHVEKGEPADVQALRSAVVGMLERLDLERRRRAGAVLAAQEAERARLARDLHDEVNQSLTGIMLRLSAAAMDAEDPAIKIALREVRDLTEQAMQELLRLSHDLRPTALDDLGLCAALDANLQRLGTATALQVQSSISGDLPELSADQQTVVFRVAQEALSNVVQHSGASAVSLSLQPHGDGVVLRVTDDGCGIGNHRDPSSSPDRSRAGLMGMRERALLVGGNLDLRSSSRGTTVELTI